MSFDEIKGRFTAAGNGTDAFRELYKDTFKLMNDDNENAIIYFLIGVAARSYVLRYDDQAVSPNFAENAKMSMEKLVEKVALSLKSPADERIKIASEVASDYHWNTHSF